VTFSHFKSEEFFINTSTEIFISGAFLQRRHPGPCIKGTQRHKAIYIYYIRTMHLDIIKVFYSPTNAQVIVLKTILKFTLKF
jgi:hypothetical protein